MSRPNIALTSPTRWLRRSAAFVFLVALLLFTQPAQHAAAGDALKFRTNVFLKGDYVVAGVNLRNTAGLNGSPPGIATGTISITVPDNATVVSALLSWQTVLGNNESNVPVGAKFRSCGQGGCNGPSDSNDISTLAVDLNPAGSSPCWSGGGGSGSGGSKRTHTYLADVLGFLPVMNGGYQANGFYEVQLPDTRVGNGTPSTAGASLVVIYRDPDLTRPLTSIVIYDGSYSMDNSTRMMTQTIQGFYQAALTSPKAKLTHIVGNGSSAKSDRLRFSTTPFLSTYTELNAFQGTSATLNASDPAWDNITRDVSLNVSPGASSATTIVDPNPNVTPFDCLTWGAIIFSTTVQDTDLDGLLDVWESVGTSGTLTDPNGQPVPDLYAMGARPNHKDLFIEVGYMGSTLGWDSATTGQVPTPGPHEHRPTPDAVKAFGDTFASAPNSLLNNPDGQNGISVHVDIGNDFPTYTGSDAYAERYIVRDTLTKTLARGGERTEEKACVNDPQSPLVCQFPKFPGTIVWKLGFQLYRDSWVGPSGEELDQTAWNACQASGTCRQRFDPVRMPMFHYLLYAHNFGWPKEPCLDDHFIPILACQATNPDYHVPGSIGGWSDLPGGDAVVALGQWPGISDFVPMSVSVHEVGHNLWRSHSGDPITPFEDNCNPNYLSIMNYLFVKDGLKRADGVPVIDFSREKLASLNENALSESVGLGSTLYRSTWMAPRATVAGILLTTAAKRHCNGTALSDFEKAEITAGRGMVRVNGLSNVTPPIDWNGDLLPTTGSISQDITFNGVINNDAAHPADPPKLLVGSEDWSFIGNLGLSQLGSRYSALGSAGGGWGFAGGGGWGFSGGGGWGFSGGGGWGFNGGGGWGFSGGGGWGFSGGGGWGFSGGGGVNLELDFATATAVGNPPHSLKAAVGSAGNKTVVNVSWKAPNVKIPGGVTYRLYKVQGATVTPGNLAKATLVAQTTLLSAVDNKQLNSGTTYTYFATAGYSDNSVSERSNDSSVTIQ